MRMTTTKTFQFSQWIDNGYTKIQCLFTQVDKCFDVGHVDLFIKPITLLPNSYSLLWLSIAGIFFLSRPKKSQQMISVWYACGLQTMWFHSITLGVNDLWLVELRCLTIAIQFNFKWSNSNIIIWFSFFSFFYLNLLINFGLFNSITRQLYVWKESNRFISGFVYLLREHSPRHTNGGAAPRNLSKVFVCFEWSHSWIQLHSFGLEP